MVAAGQSCVSKSGTTVIPIDHLRAMPTSIRLKKMPLPDPTAGTYLVVVRPDMEEALQPLLQWKRCQGYRVETIVAHTANCDSVRHMLMQRYNLSSPLRPAQRYVLIVGDVDRIASFWGKHTPSGLRSHVTDLYYGEYTGDYLPEAWVGRLSVADSSQLAQVAAKIVAYEQGRWAHAHRLLLTAGKEERDPAPTTTNGQVNYLAQMAADCRPELDTIAYRNPESDSLLAQLIADLDQCNSLVNYTAHCTAAGWSAPLLRSNALDSLAMMTPTVWVNNCCLSNAFNSHCFGEDLLRHPTAGAAGVIGATNESLWAEDYYWAVGAKYPVSLHPSVDSSLPGAMDAALKGRTFDPDQLSLGAMNYAGCCAVTMAGSPFDAFYWELYNILGDPSMTLFWGETDTLELEADTLIMAGSTQIAVRTSPWARVSATTDSSLLATTLADAEGHALLDFDATSPLGEFTLTAYQPEHIATSLKVSVERPAEAQLALADAWVTDSTLFVAIENVGLQEASAHQVTCTQNDSDTQMGAQLPTHTATPLSANLASGQRALLSWDIAGYLIGAEPILAAKISFSDSLDSTYRCQHLRLALEDERPQLTAWQICEADGTSASIIYPQHSYLLSAVLTQLCDSIRLLVNDSTIASIGNSHEISTTYETPSPLGHLHISLLCHKGNWQHEYAGWITPYHATEDFESGSLFSFPWQASNLHPWHIDSTQSHTGNYNLRSAPIGHSQKSAIALEIETLTDDSISFFYQVSSEAHDWLNFYIDGRRCGYWSGNQTWTRYSREITAGHHLLEWVYQKDASISERDDCARIDDLTLPLSLWGQPCGSVIPIEEPTLDIDISYTHSSQFMAAPNPTNDLTTLHHPASHQPGTVTLYDTYGRVVDTINIPQNSHLTQYSTAHLRLGIYLLVLRQGDNTDNCKIIVTR